MQLSKTDCIHEINIKNYAADVKHWKSENVY